MIPIPAYRLTSLRRFAETALDKNDDAKVVIRADELIDLLDMLEESEQTVFDSDDSWPSEFYSGL